MKELLRGILHKTIEKSTSLADGESVCFACYNRDIIEVIKSAVDSGNRVVFLPKYDGNRYFNNEYLNTDEIVGPSNSMGSSIAGFLGEKNVGYFALDKLTGNDLFLHYALSLASMVNAIKVVYVDHGDSGQENLACEMFWLMFADYYYARDTDMRLHLYRLVDKYKLKTNVREWSPDIEVNRKKVNKKLLLFAPALYSKEAFAACYSDTLKYRTRRNMLFLLQNMADQYDLKVVWKYLKGDGFDGVPEMIKKYRLKRITYKDNNTFKYWLGKANYFVSDCVSTTLYTAVKNKVKSFAFWDSRLSPIRESTKRMFGDSVFVYDNFRDVVDRLEQFIKSDNWELPEIEVNPDKFPWEKR